MLRGFQFPMFSRVGPLFLGPFLLVHTLFYRGGLITYGFPTSNVFQGRGSYCLFLWKPKALVIFPGGRRVPDPLSSSGSAHALPITVDSLRRYIFLLYSVKSLLASGDFCLLLITSTKSLDPGQDRQNVSPDLYPNCLTFWWCY